MLSAVAFLTVVGGARLPDARTLRWFPVVGAGIGAVLAAVWLGSAELWPPAVAAVLVVAADLAITGMLHADGLADTADGLLPHLELPRRLEVMRTPDIGAFALAVVPTVLLARWASLSTDRVEPFALVAVWSLSRTVMAVVPAVVPYARPDGLARPLLDGAGRWMLVWLVPIGLLLVRTDGLAGLVAAVAALVAATLVIATAHRRLGGFTGDVLGATGILAETAALLVLAAR